MHCTATAQARRIERAHKEAPEYTFRLANVGTSAGPVAVVYVTNPHSASIYTVHSGNRCNCPDAQHRALPGGFDCKHAVAVREWLANGAALEVSPAAVAAAATVNPADPFGPELLAAQCCDCGTPLRLSEAAVCSHTHRPSRCQSCRRTAEQVTPLILADPVARSAQARRDRELLWP